MTELEASLAEHKARMEELVRVRTALMEELTGPVEDLPSSLFMTAMMLQITGRHKLNPIPFIMMLVFATNIGSSATAIGNPVGSL